MLRSSPNKPTGTAIVQAPPPMHPSHHQPPHGAVLSPTHHLPVGFGPSGSGPPMFAAADHPTLRLMAVAAAVAAAAGSSSATSSLSSSAAIGNRPGAVHLGQANTTGSGISHHGGRQVRGGGASGAGGAPISAGSSPAPGPGDLYASYLYSRGQFDRAAMIHLMQQQQQQQQQHQRNPFSPTTASAASSSSSQHPQQQRQQQPPQRPSSMFQTASAMTTTPTSVQNPPHHFHSASSGYQTIDAGMPSLPLPAAPYRQQHSPASPPVIMAAATAPATPGFESYSQSLATLSQLSQRLHLHHHHHQQSQHQQLQHHANHQIQQCYQQQSSSRQQQVHGTLPSGTSKVRPSSSSSSSARDGGSARRDSLDEILSPRSSPQSALVPPVDGVPIAALRTKSRSRSTAPNEGDDDARKFPSSSLHGHPYSFEPDDSPPLPPHRLDDIDYGRRGRRTSDVVKVEMPHLPRQPSQRHHQQQSTTHRSNHGDYDADEIEARRYAGPFQRQISREAISNASDDGKHRSPMADVAQSSSMKRQSYMDVPDAKMQRSGSSTHSRRSNEFEYGQLDNGSLRRSVRDDVDPRGELRVENGFENIASGKDDRLSRHRHRRAVSRERADVEDDYRLHRHVTDGGPTVEGRLLGLAATRKLSSSLRDSDRTKMRSTDAKRAAICDDVIGKQYFIKGSAIQLPGGQVKNVEDLDTDDFRLGSSVSDEEDDEECRDSTSSVEDYDDENEVGNACRRLPADDVVDKAAGDFEDLIAAGGRPKGIRGDVKQNSIDSRGSADGRTGRERTRKHVRGRRSEQLMVEASRVVHVRQNHDTGTAILGFIVGSGHAQVSVEASLDHPFFVCGLGWSSCCPERTLRRYGLACRRLAIGDTCVSLLRQPRQGAARRPMGIRNNADETTHSATLSPTSSAPCVGDRPSTTQAASGGATTPTSSVVATARLADHESHTPDHRRIKSDKDNRTRNRESTEQQCSSNSNGGRPRTVPHHSEAAGAQSPVDRDARLTAASGRHRGTISDLDRSPTTFGRETAHYTSGSSDSSVGHPVDRCQTRRKPTDLVNSIDHRQDTEEQRCGLTSAAGRKRRWSAPDEASDDEGKDRDADDENFDLDTLSKPKERPNGRHRQRRDPPSAEAVGGDDDSRTSPKCCREPSIVADRGRAYGETAQLDYCNNNNNKEGGSMNVSNKMK